MKAADLKQNVNRLKLMLELMIDAEQELAELPADAPNWQRIVLENHVSGARVSLSTAVKVFIRKWDGTIVVNDRGDFI